MKKRGTPAFFLAFWAHLKAVPRFIKNDEEGHPRLFSRFWAHSKAVSRQNKMTYFERHGKNMHGL